MPSPLDALIWVLTGAGALVVLAIAVALAIVIVKAALYSQGTKRNAVSLSRQVKEAKR